MAPLSRAIRVVYDKSLPDGTKVYRGSIDPIWRVVASVPQGGYLLSIILDAIINHQTNTSQPDPIHISAHFLNPSQLQPCEIHVKTVKLGRRFSNVAAELRQNDQINIASHVIVGTLEDPATMIHGADKSMPTILSPHPLARQTPFRQHPLYFPNDDLPEILVYRTDVRYSRDRTISEQYHSRAKHPSEADDIGFQEGGWFELLGEERNTRLPVHALPFFADVHRNSSAILPGYPPPGWAWYPTMYMSIEFKVKLSALRDEDVAPHTFGVFSTGRHLHEGRHEQYVEIWTAPSPIGESRSAQDDKWREKSVCVAISSQMALTTPIAKNIKNEASETRSKL